MSTAKYLIESGTSVDKQFYKGTIPPPDISRMKQNEVLTELISKRTEEESSYIDYVSSFYPMDMVESSEITDESVEDTKGKENFARILNINVGDQKNTVSIQTCANRCPDLYGCHSPGGGDFHNCGYVNGSIARVAGPGGFWDVVETVMKRPIVNATSFKK